MNRFSSSRGRSTCRTRRHKTLVAGLAGLAMGVLAGGAALALLAGTAVGNATGRPNADPGSLIDAAHVPPLLTAPGERIQLRYDIYCAAPGDDPESGAPCDAGGSVFVRPGTAGPFRELPLRLDRAALEGRYAATVPTEIASPADGFSYYAVLRNRQTGASLTLPPGGGQAPQRSLPLNEPVVVDLGTHVFGRTRAANDRVFSAPWGDGPGEVGLEGGRQTQPIGPAAFDVGRSGALTLLDQVNRRAYRVASTGGRGETIALAVSGALADMSVEADGSLHVLESAAAAGALPLLRSFDRHGRSAQDVRLVERTAGQIRIGPTGPVVKQYPSEQWLPAAQAGRLLEPREQAARGSAARPLPDGRRVVVLRQGDEVRVALIARDGAHRGWVVRSSTAVAEVQLAEPVGNRIVVVLRVYTDERDEFLALVLGARGVEQRLALDSADWAETAPLTRFRLAGSSLYQLGSTPAGVHIDRFDLEVS